MGGKRMNAASSGRQRELRFDHRNGDRQCCKLQIPQLRAERGDEQRRDADRYHIAAPERRQTKR